MRSNNKSTLPVTLPHIFRMLGIAVLLSPAHARFINVNFAVNPVVDNQTIGADADKNGDTAGRGPDFNAFVNMVNKRLSALEAAGWTPVIRGMCWQQGEQDAKDGLDAAESETSADDYGAPWQLGDPAHPRGFFRTVGVAP